MRILMVSLALRDHGNPVSLREIAEHEDVSENYLWQVAKPLRDAGLIASVAGAGGGYHLAANRESITLLDVLTALEGEINLVDCQDSRVHCARSNTCVTRTVWQDLSDCMAEKLADISLQDLAATQRALDGGAVLSYVI